MQDLNGINEILVSVTFPTGIKEETDLDPNVLNILLPLDGVTLCKDFMQGPK
jgi:hypothetical protein